MAQTTGTITGYDMTIEYSTDGTTYTDISGSTNSVEPGGGTRKTGSQHTFGTDTPIVKAGRSEMVTVKIRALYSETAAEAAALFQAARDAMTPCYLRMRPKGALATYWQFVGGPGYITTNTAPKIDSDNAAPIAIDLVWSGPNWTKSAQT